MYPHISRYIHINDVSHQMNLYKSPLSLETPSYFGVFAKRLSCLLQLPFREMAEEWLAADQLKDHHCAAPDITKLGVTARKNFRGHVHRGAAGFLHHLKMAVKVLRSSVTENPQTQWRLELGKWENHRTEWW